MISYSLPFLSSIRFLSFFLLLHFVHHTRIPIISTSSPFFYFHLIPEAPSLFLSPALSFSTFFFFFSFSTWFHKFSSSLCDMSHIILFAFWCHYLQTHVDTHGEKGEIAFAPPHCHRCSSSSSLRSACNQGSYRLLFFFLVLD